jgi:hypothetical protein
MAPATTLSTPAPQGTGQRSSGKRLLAYACFLGGGVMVATAAVAGAVANQKARRLESDAKMSNAFDPRLEKDGKAAQGVAILTGLVGVAAAATGAVLFVTSRPAPEAALVPESSRRGRTASVLPVVAPGFAGASARFTF